MPEKKSRRSEDMTIKVGQVYKDRDRRTNERHLKVMAIEKRVGQIGRTPVNEILFAVCASCRPDGTITSSSHRTSIKCSRLEVKAKFELVIDIVEVDTETDHASVP